VPVQLVRAAPGFVAVAFDTHRTAISAETLVDDLPEAACQLELAAKPGEARPVERRLGLSAGSRGSAAEACRRSARSQPVTRMGS
jgi:hypothetical protein